MKHVQPPPEHDWTRVLDREQDEIRPHRPPPGPGGSGDLWYGLALSGGGIRSASFSLGVIQALYRLDALGKVDYLSTVSGGGYSGTALSWGLRDHASFKSGETLLPLGVRPGAEEILSPTAHLGKRGPANDTVLSTGLLNFIRRNSSYLMPGGGLGLAALVASVLQSLLLSMLVYGTWVFLVMKGFYESQKIFTGPDNPLPGFLSRSWPLTAALAGLLLLVLGAIVYAFTGAASRGARTDTAGDTETGRRFRTYTFLVQDQKIIGSLWAVTLGLAVLGTIPLVAGRPLASIVGVILGAIGGIGGVKQLLSFRSAGSETRLKWQGPALLAGSILLIYGFLLGSYALNGVLEKHAFGSWSTPAVWGAYAGLALVALAAGWAANPNYVSHHRIYRDRLMELFMPDDESIESGRWGLAKAADSFLLRDLKLRRPLQLINTNVVLVDDDLRQYRDRGGDSFLLSPVWCGSTATGWIPCEGFQQGKQSRGMTLATAMAISGAAMNPHTGPAGRGIMRSWPASTLMTLLGLRLGYWIRSLERWWPLLNMYIPGFRGLAGAGFARRARYLELSDGGHFDNTGLYELFRRRVDHILLADAGCDPDFKFNDLSNVIERARVDFGVKVEADPTAGLSGLMPGTAAGETAESALLRTKYGLAARGFARFLVEYPATADGRPGRKGTLVVIKTTLVPGLPADVYGYRSDDPAFPHQSTGDQFFDERQFEAYRELGYQLGKLALQDEGVKGEWGSRLQRNPSA